MPRPKRHPFSHRPTRLLTAASLAWLAFAGMAHAQARHAAMVIDANSGAILHDASGNEPRHPASLTKMMTLYLLFEAVEQGRMTYATKIKLSQEAASAPPSKLDLDPGEDIAALDAIKALITKSANDVAIAVAEHLGGTEAQFVSLMNQRARQLGMSRTTFRNASGLPDAAQITTAQDMLTLALRLQDEFPRHYPLFATRQFTYQGDTYRNHNTLLASFQGTDGIKTGYTRMSGFNVVTSVRRDGKHVIGAVFGGGTAGARDAHMRMILTKALAKASTERTRRSAPAMIARARPVPQPVPVSRPRPEQRQVGAAETKVDAPPPPTRPTTAPPILAPQPVEVSRGRLALRPSTSEDAAPARRFDRVMVPPLAPKPMPAVASRPAAPAAPAGPGTPPSSLQAQAARLALGGPQRISQTPLAAVPATGALQIQVGAYGTSAEAERQVTLVRGKAPELLGRHKPLVVPVQKESRQLYRARFGDFTAQSAAAACLELRRLAVDCFVMRPQ
jgi:D-alanyl-D-alanine carboxypeptidase